MPIFRPKNKCTSYVFESKISLLTKKSKYVSSGQTRVQVPDMWSTEKICSILTSSSGNPNPRVKRARMGETGLTLSPFLIGGRGGLHSPVYRWLLPKEHIHYHQVTFEEEKSLWESGLDLWARQSWQLWKVNTLISWGGIKANNLFSFEHNNFDDNDDKNYPKTCKYHDFLPTNKKHS